MNMPQYNFLKKEPPQTSVQKKVFPVENTKIKFPPVNYPLVLTNRWGDTDMIAE